VKDISISEPERTVREAEAGASGTVSDPVAKIARRVTAAIIVNIIVVECMMQEEI
jgi:hypothetical protein